MSWPYHDLLKTEWKEYQMSDGILSFRFILVSILISGNIKSKQRRRERESEREHAWAWYWSLSKWGDPDAHETLNNIFSVLICHVTLIPKHKSDILSRGKRLFLSYTIENEKNINSLLWTLNIIRLIYIWILYVNDNTQISYKWFYVN